MKKKKSFEFSKTPENGNMRMILKLLAGKIYIYIDDWNKTVKASKF